MHVTLNGEQVAIDHLPPSTTLLQFLRVHRRLTGTKEVCAEGDCGACTVVMLDRSATGEPVLRAVNSCLLLLPMVAGRQVWTVEGLGTPAALHPVQRAMVDALGSQCGYCTPGIVMSMAEAAHRTDLDQPWKLEDQLCGNLCRCTGYRPIRDAAQTVAGSQPDDVLAQALASGCEPVGPASSDHPEGHYRRPTRIAQAVALIAMHPEARLVCGATDLGLDVTKRRTTWKDWIDLSGIEELGRIVRTAEGWSIGAAVRLSDLESWSLEHLPPIARMLRFFGARQIKHLGTVGGNLCNASPIGDLPPILLALGATAVIAGPHGEHRVPLSDFFVDYRKTALKPGELLAAVEVPEPGPDARCIAYKVSKRRELDISAVSAGLFVRVRDGRVTEARLAFGGIAATPKRAAKAEAAWVGKPFDADGAQAAVTALALDFNPIDDHRGTAWYRATLAENLLRAFVEDTAADPMPALPDFPSGTVTAGQEAR